MYQGMQEWSFLLKKLYRRIDHKGIDKAYEKVYMIKEIAQITDEAEETVKDILHLL